jgi:hypothetical protein
MINNDSKDVMNPETIGTYSVVLMPDDAKVWVYQSNRELSEQEVADIENAGNSFINSWTAHGASLKASFDVIYNRFVVIAVDEHQAMASGCSIDSSVRFVKQLEQQFNLNLFDRLQVAYIYNGEIKVCHLNNLLNELTSVLGKDKNVLGEVIVFNNMVLTKAEFDEQWEIPLKYSWQSRILTDLK